MVSGGESGAPAEDQQIGERVAPKAIRTVQTGGGFAGGKKTWNGGLGGFGIHANAAHHVVAGGADFHRSFGDVHVGQFLELVIHAGELLLHVFSGLVRDVEISAAVFGAAAFFDFGVDGARNDVTRGEFHALGVVSFHEALAHFIAQDAAFAADGFGDKNALDAGRPDHSGGMELDEFHVHKLGAGFVSEGHAVAGVLPGVRSDAPGFADAAGGDDDGLGFENDEASGLAPIGKGAGDAATVGEKARDGALHVDVNALLDAAVLQGSNHFEAGAVADVAKALEGVAAEGALENITGLRAVEERAPLFEFADAVGGFLGVKLGHAPVV